MLSFPSHLTTKTANTSSNTWTPLHPPPCDENRAISESSESSAHSNLWPASLAHTDQTRYLKGKQTSSLGVGKKGRFASSALRLAHTKEKSHLANVGQRIEGLKPVGVCIPTDKRVTVLKNPNEKESLQLCLLQYLDARDTQAKASREVSG